jgi:hypothetical protein
MSLLAEVILSAFAVRIWDKTANDLKITYNERGCFCASPTV